MPVMDYPGLDQVEDEGTKTALRLMWDEIRTLDDREEVADGVSTAELDTIKVALQQGGSHQLNVSGLLGGLQTAQKTRTRQHAGWTKTVVQAGAGDYAWDKELFNTAPEIYQLSSSREQLWIRASGTYLFIARLSTLGHANGIGLRLFLNFPNAVATDVHSLVANDAYTTADNYTAQITDVFQLPAGTYLRYNSRYERRTGNAFGASNLYVLRLL